MADQVTLEYQYFPDPTAGKPVANGFLYIGDPDTDPTIPANQKSVSVVQEDGTIVPIAQPVRTSAGGVPVYNGSPVLITVEGAYSLVVQDSFGSQVLYLKSSIESGSFLSIADGVVVFDTVSDAVASTVLQDGYTIKTLGYYSVGDGGGGLYSVVPAGTGAADGFAFINTTGSPTVQLKLIIESDIINPRQAGAKLDGVTDDSSRLNAAGSLSKPVLIASPSVNVSTAVSGSFYSLGAVTVSGAGSISIKNLSELQSAAQTSYSNTISGLTATQVQAAIDELAAGGNKVLADPGYVELREGLILQFGTGVANGSGFTATNFPIAFPTAAIAAFAHLRQISTAVVFNTPASLTTTSVTFDHNLSGDVDIYWFALGY